MAAIPLADIGTAIVVKSPKWSKGSIYLKRASYPKGVTPAHLEKYTKPFKAAVAKCKKELVKGRGEATVEQMKACMSRELKKGKRKKKASSRRKPSTRRKAKSTAKKRRR